MRELLRLIGIVIAISVAFTFFNYLFFNHAGFSPAPHLDTQQMHDLVEQQYLPQEADSPAIRDL